MELAGVSIVGIGGKGGIVGIGGKGGIVGIGGKVRRVFSHPGTLALLAYCWRARRRSRRLARAPRPVVPERR